MTDSDKDGFEYERGFEWHKLSHPKGIVIEVSYHYSGLGEDFQKGLKDNKKLPTLFKKRYWVWSYLRFMMSLMTDYLYHRNEMMGEDVEVSILNESKEMEFLKRPPFKNFEAQIREDLEEAVDEIVHKFGDLNPNKS